MEKRVFKKAKFYICADEYDNSFEGYTDGDTWNGWACPYFTREVGLEILEKNWNSESYYGFFNEEFNAFVFNMEESDEYTKDQLMNDFSLCRKLEEKGCIDIFTGTEINYENKPIHVYPIGAYCWIWDKE